MVHAGTTTNAATTMARAIADERIRNDARDMRPSSSTVRQCR
jgi:hypothetical protein